MFFFFFFFKQKTAYEMRISDWSSDVCSSDLLPCAVDATTGKDQGDDAVATNVRINGQRLWDSLMEMAKIGATEKGGNCRLALSDLDREARDLFVRWCKERSEEHTSELQSLMRISYAVFCLKKKKSRTDMYILIIIKIQHTNHITIHELI